MAEHCQTDFVKIPPSFAILLVGIFFGVQSWTLLEIVNIKVSLAALDMKVQTISVKP